MRIISAQPQDLFTLDEVKTFLRVTHDADDAIIMQLINSCIEEVETVTWQSLRRKTIEAVFAGRPEWVTLHQPPIEAVEKVEYWTGSAWELFVDFVTHDLDGDIYTGQYNTVRFTYSTGVVQNAALKNAVLELVAARYDSRPHESDEAQKIVENLKKYRRWLAR